MWLEKMWVAVEERKGVKQINEACGSPKYQRSLKVTFLCTCAVVPNLKSHGAVQVRLVT
jgi:hypothetical protein